MKINYSGNSRRPATHEMVSTIDDQPYLKEDGFREHIQHKGCRHRKLTESEQRDNGTRARIRSRIEHVFGVQAQKAGNLILRTIGIVRARAKIGLRNLAYNMDRMGMLLVSSE